MTRGIDQRGFVSAIRESWVHTLEAFGVAFIGYDANVERCYVSAGAEKLFAASEFGAVLAEQADRLARAELGMPERQPRTSGFTRRRDLPGIDGLTLAVFVAFAGAHSRVVVFLPSTPSSGSQPVPGLTARENEVARLVATGLGTKEIAWRLGISSHTARHHTERIYDKLGVRCRARVARLLGVRSTPALAGESPAV